MFIVSPLHFLQHKCQGDLNFLPADSSSPGSFSPEALPPAQIHTKVKRKEETMTFLYLPASLSTSDVNEALHGFLLSKHRCFCFMGLWDGMELINQSASAVPPHSCNFKARSHTKKRQKQNRQSLQRALRLFDCASSCCPTWSPAPSPLFIPPPPFAFPLTSFLLFSFPSSGITFSHTLVSHLHLFFFPCFPVI